MVGGYIDKLLDEIFEKYDADENGYLDLDETKIFLKDYLKKGPLNFISLCDEAFEGTFYEMDTNYDGVISRMELRIWLITICPFLEE